VPIYEEWLGTISGNVDAEIRPKVEGFLLARLYTEGSFVNKGLPLFQLDKRQAQAAVEQATGNLERARAALAQTQIDVRCYTPLVDQRAVSLAELDRAQSAERAATAMVDADQAVLDNAKLNLAWTTVISPISGIAGIAKVAIGDLMTPSTVMTTISNVDPIYVDVNIAEQDYLRFQREKPSSTGRPSLELILGDGTLYPRPGRVLFLNREVDSRTGTIQAFGEVSTSLSAHQLLAQAYQEQLKSVEAYRESVRLATIRYDSGLSNYLEIIDAQLAMYPAESATVNYDLGRKVALVSLDRALGGGWKLTDTQMDEHQWAFRSHTGAVTLKRRGGGALSNG
jgi:RND family efflux transporter MFP subunit